MKKILVIVPNLPEILNDVLSNNKALINFFKSLKRHKHHKFILKTHPRHSVIRKYSGFIDNEYFRIESGENINELICFSDLVIVFESSSSILDVILNDKPIIYVTDFIINYKNESVYLDFLKNIVKLNFKELDDLLKDKLDFDLDIYKSKLNRNNLIYREGKDSMKKTLVEINKIVNECN